MKDTIRSFIIPELYNELSLLYGPRGWWPRYTLRNSPGYDGDGYHPGIYEVTDRENHVFEIAIGALLTQNTAWENVRGAMKNLVNAGCLSPEAILKLPVSELAEIIKPSGYYNQKAKKLRIFSDYFLTHYSENTVPERDQLLTLWGVGEETADSILLYGYGEPRFVIDAYTKRIFKRMKIVQIVRKNSAYAVLQASAEKELKCLYPEKEKKVRVYNEFHALIVEHCKRYCRVKPLCSLCPFSAGCPGSRGSDDSRE